MDSSLLAFIQFLDNVLDVSNVFCDVADVLLYSTEDCSGKQMIKKWCEQARGVGNSLLVGVQG